MIKIAIYLSLLGVGFVLGAIIGNKNQRARFTQFFKNIFKKT